MKKKFRLSSKNIIRLIAGGYLIFNLSVLIYGFIKNESLNFRFCLTEQCLTVFSNNFPTLISLNAWLITTIAIAIAAYSLKVSISSLEQSRKNNIFNNHINNLKFFTEHVEKKINTSHYINAKDLDINKLYFLLFPDSAKGQYINSIEYEKQTKKLRNYLINASNNTKKGSSFDYKKHQKEFIQLTNYFGFSLVNMHKKDFWLVEDAILELIDSITRTFTPLNSSYYVTNIDIHYK